MNTSDRVALVTGSSRGIGLAIAESLASRGFHVLINGRNETTVRSATERVSKTGRASALVADLISSEGIQRAVTEIRTTFGKIDVCVANIGSGRFPKGWNLSSGDMRAAFDTNFFGAVELAGQLIPLMQHSAKDPRQDLSHLIFISSIAGCEHISAPAIYQSAKAALLAYSKSLSYEVIDLGIRVNCVSPGNVMFEGGTWDSRMKEDPVSVKEFIKKNVPVNSFAKPEDIARAVDFLIHSPFVTGQNIIVDGGQTHAFI